MTSPIPTPTSPPPWPACEHYWKRLYCADCVAARGAALERECVRLRDALQDTAEALRYHFGPSTDESVGDRDAWDMPEECDTYAKARAALAAAEVRDAE